MTLRNFLKLLTYIDSVILLDLKTSKNGVENADESGLGQRINQRINQRIDQRIDQRLGQRQVSKGWLGWIRISYYRVIVLKC